MQTRLYNYPRWNSNTASRQNFQWVFLFSPLLPVLFLAFLLTGCAGGGSEEEDESAYVFETQFHSPAGGVEDFTISGNSVYYSTFDGEFYQWTPGEETRKLDIEPFTPEADSRMLQADLQGNLYVFYHVSNRLTYSDYATNYLVKYDASGKELARENVSQPTRRFSPEETAVDAEGRLYLRGVERVLLFDDMCRYAGAVEAPEEGSPEWLAGDDNGHVYCCLIDTQAYQWGVIREVIPGEESSGNGRDMAPEENQSASPEDDRSTAAGEAPIAFSGNAIGKFQPANYLAVYGENRFLTSMDNELYLYDATENSQTVLLQWANCDINPDAVQQFATFSDGRILVCLREVEGTGELALLTEIPREQASQKEIITLGTLQADNSHLLRSVSQFNRNSPDCRIEIKEYYNMWQDSGNPDAAEEARTALHLDISSGRCPDILVLEYDDLENYAAKGLLEDLTPYLKENGFLEISDNVLEAYTFQGKLFALPGALQIRTIVGYTSSLGQTEIGDGWTLEEMMEFIDSHPDKTVFSADAGQLLKYCLTFNQSYFVDQENHTCSFASDEFINLLEFCGRFSDTQEEEGKGVLDLAGKRNSALLYEVELFRPEDITLLMQILGVKNVPDLSYIGFPTLDGQPGSLLEDCGGTCAISAKSEHKKEAWDFLEILLTGWEQPPKSFAALLGTKGFPTELGTRERYFAKVMENPWRLRESGEIHTEYGLPVRYCYHALIQNEQRLYFYVPLPEETDLICELLDSATTARGSSQITSIVSQEAQAYFSGQKSAADVAAIIQNRVSVYLEEQG